MVIISVNNRLGRIVREIRPGTRAVGAFPDGNSAGGAPLQPHSRTVSQSR